jgi:hypothetical protein
MTRFKNALAALRHDNGATHRPTSGDDATNLASVASDGMELSHLGRYLVVATLVTACCLLFAWSRIEMVEISSALGSARTQLDVAKAESERLNLELAALTDPVHLSRAAQDLELTADVAVIDVPPAEGNAD